MSRTSGLDMSDTVTPEMVDDFIVDAAWAIRSTHHSVLQSSPGAAIFGRDMLFDIPYLADWKAIGKRRQSAVDQNTHHKNKSHADFIMQLDKKLQFERMVFSGKPRTKILDSMSLHKCLQTVPLGFSAEASQNELISGELILTSQQLNISSPNLILFRFVNRYFKATSLSSFNNTP